MNLHQPFYMISAYREHLPLGVNNLRHADLEMQLTDKGLAFKSVKGYYKGFAEQCFVVATDKEQESILIELMFFFCQDSILYCNQRRESELIFNNPTKTPLYVGKWSSITKEQANRLENYTVDGGRYYAAQKAQ